ncbi:MAG: T9SS C-terminal target domain-containing protein [Bacteroidetes bacterium]|nr:T9SS C-terminal target domain-containing protein [Bacteroidota bacterium]
MSIEPFLKFFSPYLWKDKVLMLFFLVSLSVLLEGQEAFFVPLPANLRTSESTVDSLLEKTLLSTSKGSIRKILLNTPDNWQLSIPLEKETNWVLSLKRVNIWADGFPNIETASGQKIKSLPAGVHYKGIVEGKKGSLVSVSVFENGISGFISFQDKGNYQINPMEVFTQGMNINHVLYPFSSLPVRKTYRCEASEGEPYRMEEIKSFGSLRADPKCIKVYYEIDYDIFQDKGGVTPSLQFLTGLFNQVGTLFSNDGIQIRLSGVKIWDIPSPYNGSNSEQMLTQFGETRTSFSGDIGQLISYKTSGGIAWVRGVCSPSRFRLSFASIDDSFQNFPTYSWSAFVMTHELGHTLGSSHTHACVWNGNNTAIDGCYSTEGGCNSFGLPAAGGTIMSYCHLRSVGVNFSLGFGVQPGNVIRNTIAQASCLTNCDVTDFELGASPQVFNFKASGGKGILKITGNAEWNIVKNSSWFTLSQSSGAGTTTIEITAPIYNLPINRIDTLFLSGAGKLIKIAVNQEKFIASECPTATIGFNNNVFCENANVNFNANTQNLGGYNLQYVWQSKIDSLTWNTVASGTDSTFSFISQPGGDFTYRFLLSAPGSDCPLITSSPATVRVIIQPQVSIETSDSTSICLGKTVTLKEKLFSPWTSALLRRQWFKSVNGTVWDSLVNATESSLIISGNEPTSSFYQLRVSVDGPSTCQTAFSQALKVDILDTVLVNVLANDSLICKGKPLQLISIAPTIGNIGFDYQWQQKNNLSQFWDNIQNANLSAYNNNSLNTGFYTFRLKYKRKLPSCPELISNELRIRVDTIPVVKVLYPTGKLCPGESLTLTAESSPDLPGIYIWQQSLNGNNWTDILGNTGKVLNYQAPAAGKSYLRALFLPANYAICDSVFSNTGFIESDTSNLVTLNLISPFSIFCLGGSGVLNLKLNSQKSLPDSILYRFEVKKDTGSWQILTEKKDTFLSYSPAGIGQYSFRVSFEIAGITCNRLYSNEINWIVGNNSLVSLPYKELNICFGSPFNLTPAITREGIGTVAYQWQQRKDFTDWNDISSANSLIYSGNDTINGGVFYRLKYKNAGEGCINLFTDSILVRKKGNTIVRIGASTLNPCSGASVILAANTLQPENEPFTSFWQESNDSLSWRTIANNSFNFSLIWNQTAARYFRFIYKSSVSGCDSSFSNVLKLIPKTGISASIKSGNSILCKGDTIFREAAVSGINGTIGLQWQWSNDRQNWKQINGFSGINLRWVPDSSGTIFLRIKVWDNPVSCDTSYSLPQEINIFNVPEIKIIPASGTYCQGQPILLTAQLSGNTVSIPVFWQQSRNGTNWINIPGADSTNYRFPAIDSGLFYFRVVSGSLGGNCSTGTSSVSTVSVIPTFAVTGLASKSEVCQNDSVTLRASWRDIPVQPFIQWYSSKDRINYSLIPGGEKAVITIKSNDPGITFYRAQLTVPGYSCGIVFSEPIPVSFQGGLSVTINTDQSISCIGTPVIIRSTVTNLGNTPVQYQWETSIDNINWEPILGAIGVNYTVQASVVSDKYYRLRLVNNTLACPLTISPSLRVSVTSIPTLVLSASKLTVCAGEEVRLQGISNRGYNLPVTWRWFRRVGTSAFTQIVGANDSFYIAPTSEAGKTSYQLRIQIGDAICASSSSSALEITVNPNFKLTLQQDPGEKCVANVHRIFAVINGANRDSLTYRWQRSRNGIQWEFVDVPSFYQWYAPVTDPGFFYRVGVQNPSGNCGISFSNAIQLTGEKLPSVTIQSDIRYACKGDFVPVTAIVSDNSSPVLYRWQFSRDNKFWNTIAEAGSLTERFNITTTGIYYFRVQILKLGSTCVAYSNTITIRGIQTNAATLTTNQGDNPILCPGVTTTLTASMGPNITFPIKYRWQYGVDGITWTNLNNAVGDKLAINQLTGDKPGYYRAVLQADSSICPLVTTPAIYIRSAGFDDFSTSVRDTLLCSGGTTLIEVKSLGNTQGLKFQWQQLEYLGNWINLTGQTGNSLSVSAPDPGVLTFRVKVSSTGSSCPDFFSRPVVITQLGTANVTLNQVNNSYCEDDILNLRMRSNILEEDKLKYRWFTSVDGLRWDSIAGANESQYRVPTSKASILYYRGTLQAKGGNCPETSATPALVKIITRYRAQISTIKTQYCAGEAFEMRAPVTPNYIGTIRYAWQISADSVQWETIPEANSFIYRSFVNPGINFYRMIAVLPNYLCDSVITPGIKIAGVNLPGVFISSPTIEICVGEFFKVTSNQTTQPGRRYFWQYSVNKLNWFTILEATKPIENLTVSTPQLYYIRMVMEGGTNCGYIYSNNLAIQGLLAPKAKLNVNYKEVCVGSTNVLYTTFKPQPFTDSINYQWEVRDSLSDWRPISGATGNIYNHTPDTAGVYFFRVAVRSKWFNCQPTYSDTLSVLVRRMPTFSITQTDTVVCTGGNLFLDARKLGGGNLTTYTWESSPDSLNWTWLASSEFSRYKLNAGLPSGLSYRARMIDPVFGCGTLTSNILKATISEQPSILVSATDTLVCLNKPIQLRVIGTNPVHPNPRFVWQYRIPGTSYIYLLKDTLSTYSPPTNRLGTLEYRVQYTLPISGCFTSFSTPIPIRVQFNCDAQEEETNFINMGINDYKWPEDKLWMDISPNPSSEKTNIYYSLPQNGQATLVITDLSGKKIMETALSNEMGVHQFSWEPRIEVSNGIYFAVIRWGDQQITKKIMYLKQ